MNKKGFTLVELLAVIAILAILVIMALPAVLRMFTQARIDTFNNELNTLIRTVRQQYLLSGGQAGIYSKDSNPLSLTGNSELNYCITINGQGQITELQATNGSYKYESNGIVEQTSSSDIETAESGYTLSCTGTFVVNVATCVEEGCTKTAIGTLLELGGEQFYVIGSEGTNTRLLAKNAINTTSNTQVTSGQTKMAFSNIGYWDGCQRDPSTGCAANSTSGLLSPYNNSSNPVGTTNYVSIYPFVYDENSNLKPAVDAYASKISTLISTTVTGTLMTYEEANGLVSSIKDCGQYYWLGSAGTPGGIWTGHGSGEIRDYDISSVRGVRPVIIVPTSAL